MNELSDLIGHISKSLVDYPEEVEVTEVAGQQTTVVN